MFNSAFWDLLGRITNYFVTFAVTVILTRLLTPADFGTFGIVLAIILFSNLLLDLGFRPAIIQTSETSQEQLSTVFYINMLLAVVLMTLLIIITPSIESFYEIKNLSQIVLVTSVIFIFNSLSLVPSGLLIKAMQFKKIALVNSVAAIISGTIAIALSMQGYGVWCLVAQQLINTFVIAAGNFWFSRWLPSLLFKISSIKPLWKFGSKLFLSGLIDTTFSRLDVFIIGKLFNVGTLGYYNRAQSIDSMVKNFSSSTATSLMFPFFSKMQDDSEKLKFYYIRSLHIVSFLAFSLVGFLFLTSFDVIILLFSDKWLPVVGFFRIMVLSGFAYPISAVMVTVISAKGNSQAFLNLEIIKKFILIPMYLSFFFGGIHLFLVCLGIAYMLMLVVNALFIKREIGVSIPEHLNIFAKYVLTTALVTFIVYFVALPFEYSIYTHFLAASITYAALYAFLSYKLNLAGFNELFNKVKGFFNDKRNESFSSSY